MKTAVITLNWNGQSLMEAFLPQVVETCRGIARVIIADNASTDNSVAWTRSHFKEVEIIINESNEGFAKGYNSALSKVDSEYFLLLNSDVEVSKNWLQPLIQHLDSHKDVAVCQPKIRWQKQKEKFEYAGAAGGYLDAFGYPFCRGRIFGEVEEDRNQYDQVAPIFWASGACMMIRSEVFWKAGGFDPLFFAHMEEIDLCWRIQNMGFKIECIPQSLVFHVGGATLPNNNSEKTLLNFRNNLSMLYKNLPGTKLLPVLFCRLLLDGVAGIKFLTEGGFADCCAVIQAHFQFYIRIITGRLKRDTGVDRKNHPTMYNGLIVLDYYLMNKKRFSELHFNPSKSVKS